MRIRSLHLRNFRGIRDLELPFPPDHPVVLVGANGAGKTGVLDCAAILLSRLEARILSPTAKGRSFSADDVSVGEKSTANTIEISCNGAPASWTEGRRPDIGKSDLATRVADLRGRRNLRKLAEEIREQLAADEDSGVPLMVYYPVNRAVLDIPLRIRKTHQFHQAAAYDRALSGGSANFRIFFEWFRQREDYENEQRLDDPELRDHQLEAVRGAVEALIPDFSRLRVRRKPLRMTVLKQWREIAVQQLSDGEKCLLALTGDLARRLAIANPSLERPRQGVGVVMIDEIELHLHPSWQRNVIPALERTFPNCQFIVTTHSPAVLGHVQPRSVFLLERTASDVEVRQLTTFGQDANRILEGVFDVPARPAEFEARLRELFALIEGGDLVGARRLSSQLTEELGTEEPELVKAEAYIRRKEILGR
jgi:predicted ATP-binding protein involved in virulence